MLFQIVISKVLTKQLKRLVGPDYARRRYLVAVSGGVDSVVLADLMLSTLPVENLVFAHFDHRVRKTAQADARFVESYSEESGVKMVIGARCGQAISEGALRIERLAFLKGARVAEKCDYIVTAHHLDDQLETFFMRLARGAGIDGLSAMKPRNGRFLKPLLAVCKADVLVHAKARGLTWVEDETNAGTAYFRNRVRHRLIPEWKKLVEEYGGESAFYRRFSQLTKELRTRSRAGKKTGRKLFRRHVVVTPYWIRLPVACFDRLSGDEQALLLREIVSTLEVETLPREDLKRLRRRMRDRRSTAFPGFHLSHSCGQLFFQTAQMAKRPLRPISGVSVDRRKYPNAQLRTFRPGDRVEGKKLKKLLLKYRIPKLERQLIPVLAAKNSGEVMWFHPMPASQLGIDVAKVKFPFSFQA